MRMQKMWCCELYYDENHVEVTVEDDGIGFLPNQFNDNSNIKHQSGLINIKKRAKLINGNCTINSQPGKGTSIHLSIPY